VNKFGLAYVEPSLRHGFASPDYSNLLAGIDGGDLERDAATLNVTLATEPLFTHFARALSGQAQYFEAERLVAGQRRSIQFRLIPDIGTTGQTMGVYVTAADVTDLNARQRRLRELSDIGEHTPDYLVQGDINGQVLYLNPAARRAFGLGADVPAEELRVEQLYSPETNARFAGEIMPTVLREGLWVGETTIRQPGGGVQPVSHLVVAHREASGHVGRYTSILRDISQVVAARAALQQQTSTLSAIIEAIPAIVVVYDAQLRYRLVNSAFERWRGLRRAQVIGKTIEEVFDRHEYERSLPWAERALAGETVSHEKAYPAAGAATSHLSFSYVPLRLEDGTITGMLSVAQDVTPHRDAERRLLNLAEHDALTGVLNRAGFNAFTERLRPGTAGKGIGLLYVDLDHFKPINDTHGHAVGDQVLRQFANRLLRLVRPTDGVARLGGDEFAVVLVDLREHANAEGVADKIVEAASAPFEVGTLTLQIGASVGVAFGLKGDTGWAEIIERADAALYRAKHQGRGRRA
jgi:diguanylate cyclase (GGDEF)-like protein/PAS domain S-box-containing protein